MAKNKNKKSPALSINQGDNEQAQSLFEQYHEIAQALHSSSDQQQAEVALESVTGESEAVQMALLKTLARTQETDAADILLALNALSPLKDVRKEARRGLIQLEQSKTYPSWQPPIERTPEFLSTQDAGNPPRFWKGYINGSRAIGEANVLLMWEQGEDYRDVRTVGFLLEFWTEGVKDFFTFIESKRRAQKEIDENVQSGQFIPCSLAKAKRLILEALDVNKKMHISPYRDYRLNVSLVNQLILEAPDIGAEEPDETNEENEEEREEEYIEGEETLDLTQLTPNDVIVNFVEAWVDEDYELAYDLLASNSPLREGLSQDDWVARRNKWAEEAQPDWLRPAFVREHENPASGIWLPNPLKRRPARTQELEAGWSIELKDTAYVEALPELMRPTLVYQETGRHWFWITYTFVREEDRWCIHSVADEGERTRALTAAQIKKRVDELGKKAAKVTAKTPVDSDITSVDQVALMNDINDVFSLLNTTLFMEDILLAKPEADETAIKEAYDIALSLRNYERAITYLDILMERFPALRAEMLPIRAATQMQLIARYSGEDEESEEDEEEGEDVNERIERLNELVEADLLEALNIKNTAQPHMLLGQLLYEWGDETRWDEAEAHLHAAEGFSVTPLEATIIEQTLGDIAAARAQYEQALIHYQRVAEVDPQYGHIWHSIGDTYLQLDKPQDAEASFKKDIELHPADLEVYNHLIGIYEQEERFTEARELIEQGLLANPDSPYLLALLAAIYYDSGDREAAVELLNEAEQIDPDQPIVKVYREAIKQLDLKREQKKE